MKHVEEEDLILYHYGEGDVPAVGEHLDRCADCRGQYDRLERLFGTLDQASVPERSDDYAEDVWQRLQGHLPQEASRPWWALGVPRLQLTAALAVLLLVAFMLGRFTGDGTGEPIPGEVRERILLVAVGDHLERSQRLLIELVNAEGNGTVDIAAEQRKAEALAVSNRLYRQSAARGGDPVVAELLDELERTLLEVANADAGLASSELDELRRRIERRGILFRIRVIGDRVRKEGAVGALVKGEV